MANERDNAAERWYPAAFMLWYSKAASCCATLFAYSTRCIEQRMSEARLLSPLWPASRLRIFSMPRWRVLLGTMQCSAVQKASDDLNDYTNTDGERRVSLAQ